MAIHCSILAWRIPWTEEPGGLQSVWSYGRRELDTTEATDLAGTVTFSCHVSHYIPRTCLPGGVISHNWMLLPFDHPRPPIPPLHPASANHQSALCIYDSGFLKKDSTYR